LSNLEASISQHEKDIKFMDVSLASDYDKTTADAKFFDRYKGKKSKLANLMTEWETIHEDLEQIR
jgi:ATP-binding cassette subfamily F protein 3